MIRRLLVVVLVAVAAVTPSSSQPLDAVRRANAILDAGIAALGGLDALQAIRIVSFSEKGSITLIGQSMTSAKPYGTLSIEHTTIVDRPGRRAVAETLTHFARGPFRQAFAIDGDRGFTVDHQSKSARPLSPIAFQTHFDRALRLPQVILLNAREHAHDLRDLGDATFEGRRHQVIAAPLAGGRLYELYFDGATHLLSKVQFQYPDPLAGDAFNETRFRDYRKRDGHLLPAGRTVVEANEVAERLDFATIEINPTIEAARFGMPAGYEQRPAQAPRPRNAVQQIAKDVYLLEGIDGVNVNAMFVAFTDYVLVLEAPEDETYRQLGETVLRIIHETLPGKPVRYIVPSHHHVDHGSGIRPYIAEGTTIVTTPANVAFMKSLASLRFVIRPDALALKPRAPVIETIDNKQRTFRDASHIVEFHEVGPEVHTQETVVAWFPNERILFLADMFETGYGDVATWDGKGYLGQIISNHKWNVETVVTPHSRVRRIADLRPPQPPS